MNGILLIDKPAGWTSNDVVVKLKGALRQRRIGHSGTLDPMATGLLVVFIGRATRAVSFAEADAKHYLAGLRLGITTDTQDTSGAVLQCTDPEITMQQLQTALSVFTGDLQQVPPMYSAIKVNGQKLYDIARKGGEVERKPRTVTVSQLELVGRQDEDYLLEIHCSKGTYIRTLCHDIGRYLGCGGCMSSLRRTQAGVFSLEQAHTLETVLEAAKLEQAENLLLPVDFLFSDFPAQQVGSREERRIRCGNEIPTGLADGKYRIYSQTGEFLMLGQADQGMLRTIKSFFEVEV